MEPGLSDEEDQETKYDEPTVKEVMGNLFKAPQSHSLAHCISKDGKMSKGIAKQFRNHFGRVGEIKRQRVEVGGVAILREGTRLIYNLITKEM